MSRGSRPAARRDVHACGRVRGARPHALAADHVRHRRAVRGRRAAVLRLRSARMGRRPRERGGLVSRARLQRGPGVPGVRHACGRDRGLPGASLRDRAVRRRSLRARSRPCLRSFPDPRSASGARARHRPDAARCRTARRSRPTLPARPRHLPPDRESETLAHRACPRCCAREARLRSRLVASHRHVSGRAVRGATCNGAHGRIRQPEPVDGDDALSSVRHASGVASAPNVRLRSAPRGDLV